MHRKAARLLSVSGGGQEQGAAGGPQVLLSQVHRARALALLGRFLDLGSWAVDLALSVGIFPYVLKLLQTSSAELRDTLVFIWTKILALDRSCQVRRPPPLPLPSAPQVQPVLRGPAAGAAALQLWPSLQRRSTCIGKQDSRLFLRLLSCSWKHLALWR